MGGAGVGAGVIPSTTVCSCTHYVYSLLPCRHPTDNALQIDTADNDMSPLTWKRAILRVSDALAGLATTFLLDLKNLNIVDPIAYERIKKKAMFAESRGLELALCLRLCDGSQLLKFIEKNKFLMRAIDAAAEGFWESSQLSIRSLPDLPEYFVERTFFEDRKKELSEAINSKKKYRLALHGQGGAGKSTCAAFLARHAPVSLTLWIHFGQRPHEAVFESAQGKIIRRFPSSDPDHFATPKEYLSATLTEEATQDVVIVADDVWKPHQLEPFKKAKMMILTSRTRMLDQHENCNVPLSLEESEGLDLMENIVEKSLKILKEAITCRP